MKTGTKSEIVRLVDEVTDRIASDAYDSADTRLFADIRKYLLGIAASVSGERSRSTNERNKDIATAVGTMEGLAFEDRFRDQFNYLKDLLKIRAKYVLKIEGPLSQEAEVKRNLSECFGWDIRKSRSVYKAFSIDGGSVHKAQSFAIRFDETIPSESKKRVRENKSLERDLNEKIQNTEREIKSIFRVWKLPAIYKKN